MKNEPIIITIKEQVRVPRQQQKLKIFVCPWDICALSSSPYYSNEREERTDIRGKQKDVTLPVSRAVVVSVLMLLCGCMCMWV